MSHESSSVLPLLPLLVDRVPDELLRMLAQEGVPVAKFENGRRTGSIVLYDSAQHAAPQALLPEQQLLDVAVLRCGESIDPFRARDCDPTARTVWQVGTWEVGEETSAADRRQLRERVLRKLRGMVERAGGVWMRLSPFPHPYRTAANFRFDHDHFVEADYAAVLEAIRGREAMTTHFVCAATHEDARVRAGQLRDCDVGSHGYRHHTYRTRHENLVNIAHGIDVLRRFGFEPSGFAAPGGRYNQGLAEALAELGITHSSEFAAAYDELPYFGSIGDVLQLPIHPVCLGVVLEAISHDAPTTTGKEAADATAEYFAAVVLEKHAAREPILLYGHPDGRLGRYPQVLRRFLDTVEALPAVWRTTLTEYQQWWRARAHCEWSVVPHAAGYQLRAAQLTQGYEYAVQWVTAKGIADIPLVDGTTTSLCNVSFEPVSQLRHSLPLRVDHVMGLRGRVKDFLDWEFETPLDEIDAGEWRGWLKRTLRRFRSESPARELAERRAA